MDWIHHKPTSFWYSVYARFSTNCVFVLCRWVDGCCQRKTKNPICIFKQRQWVRRMCFWAWCVCVFVQTMIMIFKWWKSEHIRNNLLNKFHAERKEKSCLPHFTCNCTFGEINELGALHCIFHSRFDVNNSQEPDVIPLLNALANTTLVAILPVLVDSTDTEQSWTELNRVD